MDDYFKFLIKLIFLKNLAKFTGNKPLPKILVHKIDKHFKYFWQNDRLAGLTANDKYLKTLPKPLRIEVFLIEFKIILFRLSNIYLKIILLYLEVSY